MIEFACWYHASRLFPWLAYHEGPDGIPLSSGVSNTESSSGGESHPSALTEPDVKLSPHPALTLRPRAERRVASARTGEAPAARCGRASAPTPVHGAGTARSEEHTSELQSREKL